MFCGTEHDSKIFMEMQKAKSRQDILEVAFKVGGLALTAVRTHHEAGVVEDCVSAAQRRSRAEAGTVQSTPADPWLCVQSTVFSGAGMSRPPHGKERERHSVLPHALQT